MNFKTKVRTKVNLGSGENILHKDEAKVSDITHRAKEMR